MKFNIYINQKSLIDLGFRGGIDEAIILEYLYYLCSSVNPKVEKSRKEKEGKRYTWFNYSNFFKENPLIKVKSKSWITPRIGLLEGEGFIETFQDMKSFRKYVRLLPKIMRMFSSENGGVLEEERGAFSSENIDNSINDSITNDDIADKSAGSEINDLIELFKPLNPSYKILFSNKTQRKCLKRMIAEHGAEKVKGQIKHAVSVSGQEFSPVITTPYQLENKLGSLLAFEKIKKEKKKNDDKKNGINRCSKCKKELPENSWDSICWDCKH